MVCLCCEGSGCAPETVSVEQNSEDGTRALNPKGSLNRQLVLPYVDALDLFCSLLLRNVNEEWLTQHHRCC